MLFKSLKNGAVYDCSSFSQLERVIFYKDNEIILSVEASIIEYRILKDNKAETQNYNKKIDIILLDEIKRANKENLKRQDNYILKNNSRERFDNPYNLYIYIDNKNIKVKNLGEFLDFEIEGAKYFRNYYQVYFNNTIVTNYKIEREICENYTLKDNEKFSDCYGTKENPCISYYDMNNRILNPRNEKGIIRRWREQSSEELTTILFDRQCTRTEKDNAREEREELAKIISDLTGKNISHYDINKLQEQLYITKKAQ